MKKLKSKISGFVHRYDTALAVATAILLVGVCGADIWMSSRNPDSMSLEYGSGLPSGSVVEGKIYYDSNGNPLPGTYDVVMESDVVVVDISDTVPPKFTKSVESLEYKVGEGSEEAVLSNFEVEDASEISEMYIYGEVDWETEGTYEISVCCADASMNTTALHCTINIVP